MPLTLVRKSSIEPNITNRDDARMIRYAYGGYDGYVKGFGSELEATIDSPKEVLHIGSGRIVLQGWEVDIDEAGVETQILSSASNAVYLEINLLTETAAIYNMYATGDNEPYVPEGDDLTASPNGVARLVLFRTDGLNAIYYKLPAIDYMREHVLRHDDSIEGFNNFVAAIRNHCILFTAYDNSNTYRLSVSFNIVRSRSNGFTLTELFSGGEFNCSGVFAQYSSYDEAIKSYTVDRVQFKSHASGWQVVLRYWDMDALDPIMTITLDRNDAPNFRFSDTVVNI